MARSLTPKASNMSRLRRFAQNHLGVVMGDDRSTTEVFRDADLDKLDLYYESKQYDKLMNWEDANRSDENIPVRERKPRIIYNLPKVLVNKIAAKLVGSSAFPTFTIEDDDDDTAFFRTVQKACKFRSNMIAPMKHMLISGAVFVRYYLINGSIQIEYAKSKYCYPIFDAVGELDSIEIKYVYDDWQDKDSKGNPKKKWYRLLLSKMADILFDNPEYREGNKPEFVEVSRADHGLGWVQGEWFVTHKDKFDFDGYSVFGDILDFIDELNYSLSQTSQAISYNQEPQLTVTKMDENELDALVRSSTKAWNMGREGEAAYLQSDMKGIEAAQSGREHFRNLTLDVARVVIHDPEKMATAQSGAALEILHAPLVELVDELRAIIEPNMVNLLIKIGMTALKCNADGEETAIEAPAGYMPSSLDLVAQWPAIFPLTLTDILQMSQAATAFSQGKIVSRKSLTRWIAANTDIIDNVDEELSEIESEPDLNPFGSFGGPGE